MSELGNKERIVAAGYLPWAIDLSGQRFLAPDGFRLVTLEQALAELDDSEAEAA
jgi:hypothetical protein